MTIDIDSTVGQLDDPVEVGRQRSSGFDRARKGLLVYLAMMSLSDTDLALVPLGDEWRFQTGKGLSEGDFSLLVATLPGTDIRFGLSKRLYLDASSLVVTRARQQAWGSWQRWATRSIMTLVDWDLVLTAETAAEESPLYDIPWETLVGFEPPYTTPSYDGYLELEHDGIYVAVRPGSSSLPTMRRHAG